MKVVERYILSRAFLLFLGTLVATLLIVWIVQALTRINLITTNGQSTRVFLEISTLILPSIIPEVLPFAIAIAVAQTLVAMNTDSELVIINAAGSPRTAVMRPVLILALAASILSLVITNLVDPYARLQFRKMITAARGDLISVALQEGTFRELAHGLYIQIGERLPGGDLSGVFVADSRHENIDLIYYAKKGSLADAGPTKMLLMRDGMIQRKQVGGDVSVVRFHSYAFDLSQFGPAGDWVSLFPRDRSLQFLLNPDPDDAIYKRIPGEFRAELHRRLAEWSFPLVFALIALAVAGDARSHRESRVSPLITVVVLALMVRWAAFIAVDRAEKSTFFVAMIYAVPLIAAAIAIRFILANRTLELPVRLVDVIGQAYRRTNDRLLLFGMRMRRLAIPEKAVLLMGWTLGRYFLLRYASITFWFFVGIYALVSLIDFSEFANRASGIPGYTARLGLTVSALRVPMIMQQTVPFIALFSAMATLVSLNRRYELVIARSAGISAWQFLFPACLGAFLFGVMTIGVLNPLAAKGFSYSERLETELRSGKSNSISAFQEPWLRQKTAEGDTIIGARAVLNEGLELADAVFFSISTEGEIVARRDAARAHLRDGYWELQDVRLLTEGMHFERRETDRIATNLKPEFVQERLARPETIPFLELPGKIEVARSFGLTANSFATQFHSLAALPLLLVAMTLIAATVSMRFARMGQSVTMILGGIIAGFLLYVVTVLVKAFGNAGFVPPFIVAWIPVVVAMFFGVTFLLYKEDG